MSDWSPERPCPTCGAGVQTYSGPRRQFPTTFLAGTWLRHYHHEPQPEKQVRQCPECFEHYDAELLDPRGTRWSEHGCPVRPKYEPTPVVLPAPVKVEMALLGPQEEEPIVAIPRLTPGSL